MGIVLYSFLVCNALDIIGRFFRAELTIAQHNYLNMLKQYSFPQIEEENGSFHCFSWMELVIILV